ncbi:MAG: hypothetical protein RSE20_10785, partial [Eubacterium sp.]
MAEIKVKQKSRTRNLFGIQYADVIQDNETTYEAGKKVDLPGAISIKLTDNFESENLYSDGGIEEPLGQFTGGDGELEINRLAPQERDALLNQIYLN